MSLPNTLTVSRIFLTFLFLLLISQHGIWPKIAAVIVFLAASFTDFFDGYYAKKHNLITNFGKFMDPVADKFLILAAFFVFLQMNLIALWMFAVIAAREVGVTLLRLFAAFKGEILAAERLGKCKTVSQIFVVCFILAFIVLKEFTVSHRFSSALMNNFQNSIQILMLMVVTLTLVSGISYLWNNRKIFYSAQ